MDNVNAIYILKSKKDQRTYVGSTTDLDRRLQEHASGKVKATKNRRPLELLYSEEYPTIDQARKRERYLKTAAGRKYIKQKLFSNYGLVAKR